MCVWNYENGANQLNSRPKRASFSRQKHWVHLVGTQSIHFKLNSFQEMTWKLGQCPFSSTVLNPRESLDKNRGRHHHYHYHHHHHHHHHRRRRRRRRRRRHYHHHQYQYPAVSVSVSVSKFRSWLWRRVSSRPRDSSDTFRISANSFLVKEPLMKSPLRIKSCEENSLDAFLIVVSTLQRGTYRFHGPRFCA